MLIIKADVRHGLAEIHLTVGEVSLISKLMYEAGHVGQTRTQFYLLQELLSHGAYDSTALEIASGIMSGKKPGEDKVKRVCATCEYSAFYNGKWQCWGQPETPNVKMEDTCEHWKDGSKNEKGKDEPGSGDSAD